MNSSASVFFVAGASGYTGRGVLRALAQRSLRFVAHVRPDSPRLDGMRAEVAALGGELDTTEWQADALTQTLTRLGPTHVVALLGTTRARARAARSRGSVETYETVDLGLTLLLLDAAVRCAAEPRFVYLSAAGVGQSATGAYYQARVEAERAIVGSLLPWTIVRPSFITGADREESRTMERTVAAAADAGLALASWVGFGRLRQRYSSMSGAELGEGIVRAALDPARARQILHSEDLRVLAERATVR